MEQIQGGSGELPIDPATLDALAGRLGAQALGRAPSVQEVAEMLGVDEIYTCPEDGKPCISSFCGKSSCVIVEIRQSSKSSH